MKRKLILMVMVLMAASLYALAPNFNINAGRRLARYSLELVDENGIPDPNGTPRYSLSQLTNQATAQIAINKFGVTDPNVQEAITTGWAEIQAEAVRVYRIANPTPEEATLANIRSMILTYDPNAVIRSAGSAYLVLLDGQTATITTLEEGLYQIDLRGE